LKFFKNTPLHVIFLNLFSVFRNVVKHVLSCLIYYMQTHLGWGTCAGLYRQGLLVTGWRYSK